MFIIVIAIIPVISASTPSVDTTPPVISPVNDVTVTLVQGQANIGQAFWIEPTATDDSGQANLITRSHTPGDFFQVGVTPVTYVFADPSGNRATLVFNVNVVLGM